jgi:hypothetical protein
LGDKYTPLRLNSACEKAPAVDLIDVRRVERILIYALEQEAMPVRMMTPPPGRFDRPGNVFAIGDNTGGNHNGNHIGNHPDDQHEGETI